MLSIITFLPVATVLTLLLVSRGSDRAVRFIALFGSLTTLGFALALLFSFDPGQAKFQSQLTERWTWVQSLGISYTLGIDGISLFLVVLAALLTPIAILASWTSIDRRILEFHICLLLLETGMIGVFLALDLVLFYVFWEVMLIPMYLLIGIWGSGNRVQAAVKFFLYTVAGSLLMFLGILYLYGHVAKFEPTPTFDVVRIYEVLQAHPLGATEQMMLFLAFAFSFAIKVPLFPFHTWLPDAHTEAPTAGSVILAGVLLKMGTYGFLRFAMPFFPLACQQAAPWISALAVIGIIFGALMCLAQEDMKKLVAYSSVSHLGFVMLGLFAFNLRGISGGVVQMINHGLSTGALFLLIGAIYERRHTRMIAEYGGVAALVPKFAVVFFITTFASIGLPFLNGFVGELLILQGTFEVSRGHAVLAATGVVLGAVYMLTLCRRFLLGPVSNHENHELTDLNGRELGFLIPLVLLMVGLGVFSPWLTDRVTPSVEHWLEYWRQVTTAR